jgi:hypothetical protein
MITPPNQQSDEYLQARIESCKLLGLDPDDLSSLEAIRADIVTTLRTWLDGTQGQLLSGGTADPTKILAVAEALGKLVPEREHRSRGEDPRQHMWATYIGMRRRGEISDRAAEPSLREQLAKVQAENAALRVEIEALRAVGGAAQVESAPAAPLPDNVVPLTKPAAPAPAAAPSRPFVNGTSDLVARYTVPDEPWREHMNANYDPWADNR